MEAVACKPGDPRCWSLIGVWGEADCPELPKVVHCHNCPIFEAAGRSLLERGAEAAYVEEWTGLLERAKAVQERETVSVTVFRLGSEWLALRTENVREITEVQPIRTVPHRTGTLFRGLVNIRGELHLSVSLRDLLGLESASGVESTDQKVWQRMMVGKKDGDTWVFPTDEVQGVVRIRQSEVQPVPVTVAKDQTTFSRGLFEDRGRTIGLLDEELLFYALKRRIF